MARDWNIRPRGTACAKCGKEFEKGQKIVSAVFDEEAGFERRDFCRECWDEKSGAFSFWEGVYTPVRGGVRKEDALKHETAGELIRKLVALDDPDNVNVIYILAVMLERKKQFIERSSRPREEGGFYRVYEDKATAESFVIVDPQLKLDEIGEVQQQVITMLEGGARPKPVVKFDFDVVIRGGLVADGEGGEPFKADVAVKGGRIVAVGSVPREATAAEYVDAEGCVVAPGFIDVHSHSDAYVCIEPEAPSKLVQGVTTEITGQCGISAAPLIGKWARHDTDWMKYLAEAGIGHETGAVDMWSSVALYREALERNGHALNHVLFAGHNTIRECVMGFESRTARADEIRKMTRILAQALDEGASGLSTGLAYIPGRYSDPGETLALARETAKRGGFYATHMRSEGDKLLESIAETLNLVRKTGIRAQISHLKAAGKDNWHKLDEALEMIEGARAAGMKLHADRYPYCKSETSLDSRLPDWATEGGNDAIMKRLQDETDSARIASELRSTYTDEDFAGMTVGVTFEKSLLQCRGKTIADVAAEWGCDCVDAYLRILRTDGLATQGFFGSLSERNMLKVLSEPYVMVGSDASIRATEGPLSRDFPHPRAYGTFARFIRMALDGKLPFGLGEAIRKTTSLPADAFGMTDRGRIKEGKVADITVFSPEKMRDTATYADPSRYAEGVRYVVVNGHVAYNRGEMAPKMYGEWIKLKA